MMGHGTESGEDTGHTVNLRDLQPSLGGEANICDRRTTNEASLAWAQSHPLCPQIGVTSVLQRLASRETQRNLPSM